MDIRKRGKSKSALRVSAIRRGDIEEIPERERIDGDMMFKDFIKMYMQDRIEERQQIAELREEVRNIWGGTQGLIRKETEEQMGDTEKGADQLDEQIWGSDEEEGNEADENEDGTNEEKENSGKKEGNKELTTKESAPTDKEESSDSNGESENNKNQINEEDLEYDDDQIDPYHSKQPELLKPEPMDLPDDLQLDDNEKGNEEDEDENPFNIDAMKEQMPPENENENQEQENDDPNVEKGDATEEDDSNNSENSNKPDAHETEKYDTDNQKETAQFDDAMDPEAKEDVEKNEQSRLDKTSAQDAQAQPMDVDNNTNESADNVHANQAKNRISCKDESVTQQEEDKDCKEEDKAFEMSEDFDSKIHGAHRNQDEDSQDEYHSDAESDCRIIKNYDNRIKGIT